MLTIIERIGHHVIVKQDSMFAAINTVDRDETEWFNRARDAREYVLRQVDLVDGLAALAN